MTARQILRVDVVASVFNGKTPSKLQQRDSGHSVLKIKDVDKLGRFRGTFSGHVDPQLAKKHVRQQLVGGETLVLNAAHSATHVASKTFYAGHEVVGALATGEWLIVRWRDDTADPRYGNHWINAAETRFRLRRLVNGIHLYPKDVARLQIPLPPLAEQKRIAGILDAVDALRAKRREALAQLDTLLQSTFLDMFGDPVTNPKGLDVELLGELIAMGPQNGLYKPERNYGSGVRILRIDGFYGGVVNDPSTLKRVNVSEQDIEKYGLSESDIVINRVNSRSHLGKSALIPDLGGEPILFESNMMRLAVDSTRVSPLFMIHFLQTSFIRNQILRSAKDSINQASINQGDVKGLRILVPSVDSQQHFVSIAESIGHQKSRCCAHLDELDTLFASLQSRAFRGDL